MITKREESKIDLTPNSQPEPITQDTPQQTPRDEQLNNLIEEMEIEKKTNKRKPPTPSEETQNQEDQEAIENNSQSASKTRAGTRKSRQKNTLLRGKKTGRMSSYKDQTTRKTKDFQKKGTKRSEYKSYPVKQN